ncbi:MAG: hypothetical protein IT512_06995 [Rhodocyclaceae bacterium]|nr:hypothetical protein [Rhodocyclaceae bacterium]
MLETVRKFQIRHRRPLRRVAALLGVGLVGTLAMLPRADAQMAHRTVAATAPASLYLTPVPLSSAPFGRFYGLPHP